VLSLSRISTPTLFDDVKECREHFWEFEDDNKKGFICLLNIYYFVS
jgi:hypothetical protein